MHRLIKIILMLLIGVSFLFASFDEDIDVIADEIADNLKLSLDKPLYLTAMIEDRRYMLSMEPVYKQLKKKLKKHTFEVRFKNPQGSEIRNLIEFIQDGNPMKTEDMTIDSLILTGSYYLTDQSPHKINCMLKIQDKRANSIYESDEFTISVTDCPPSLKRIFIEQIMNKDSYGELEYKGYIINKLDQLFNAMDNNLLHRPAEYSFVNWHTYAIKYQINVLQDIFNLKYSIIFNPQSENKIVILNNGTLQFIRDGKVQMVPKIIDGEPLFGNDFSAQCSSYQYISKSTESSGKQKVEEKQFNTKREVAVRDKIFATFNTSYPSLFSPFNYNKLNDIFVDKEEPTILVGKVIKSDPTTGKEMVNYSWQTKQHWLNYLKRRHDDENRRFEVKTSVMKVFNDDLDPNRYWAIVRQNWKTKDSFGKTIYQDEGFLFVNFDFTVDRVLKDFKIYYRLWFYEYQYDDHERGIKRYAKLQNDIEKHFKNEIKGVSENIKGAMSDFLIGQIRRDGSGLKLQRN